VTTIVITPDENFLAYVLCSLSQIARFGRRADGVVLVVPASTPEQNLVDLVSAASRLGIALSVVPLSEADSQCIEQFRPLRRQDVASYATYIRLLIPEVLREHDEVLYLDVDTLIRAPLDELLEWKLREPLAAVTELDGSGEHLFGTSQTPYFNGGILRMSLERLRGLKLWEAAQDVLSKRQDIRWYDQDVLNVLFEGRFDSLPLTFNVSDRLVRQNLGLPLFEDPAIVHFNGGTKPWQPNATSRFAREWQKLDAETRAAMQVHHAAQSSGPADYARSDSLVSAYAKRRAQGHGKLSSLARVILPADAKASAQRAAQLARRSALGATRNVLGNLERIERRLNGTSAPGLRSDARAVAQARAVSVLAGRKGLPPDEGSHELDLMVSVARSGTNALGVALQQSCAELNWMNELYLGAGWSQLQAGELAEVYPWFVSQSPELIASMPRAERIEAFRSFKTKVSEHAVDLTKAILRKRSGRTLIKIFPEQLNASALEEILAVFRPRLLFVRREMIFTHVSRLRASHRDACESTFAKSWMNTDLTEVEFAVDERQALQYAAHCDDWFDSVEVLAEGLGLQGAWVTYRGLFATGDDVARLELLYPGATFAKTPGSKGLQSTMLVQDRKTDPSVLALIKAVASLSTFAQAQLLRLPGRHASSADT
jgi:lipopolysaccharide biosynthesis glycosyltransferase